MRVIGNPYDDSVFRLRPEIARDKALVFVGRLVSDKGVDVLLRALNVLRSFEENVQPASAVSASRTDSSRGEDGLRRAERPTPDAQRSIEEYGFEKALDDDLNISAALGVLFETIRETNRAMDRQELDATSATAWLKWWQRIDTVLDVEAETEIKPPAEVLQLAKEREIARRDKNWKRSDQLRDQIFGLGWEARDTKDGQKLARRGGSG